MQVNQPGGHWGCRFRAKMCQKKDEPNPIWEICNLRFLLPNGYCTAASGRSHCRAPPTWRCWRCCWWIAAPNRRILRAAAGGCKTEAMAPGGRVFFKRKLGASRSLAAKMQPLDLAKIWTEPKLRRAHAIPNFAIGISMSRAENPNFM